MRQESISGSGAHEPIRDGSGDLHDSFTVGMIDLDAKGCIRRVSPAGAALLGLPWSRLENLPFFVFVAQSHVPAFYSHLRRCRETGERQATDLSLKIRNRPPLPVRLESTPTRDPARAGIVYRTAFLDVADKGCGKKAVPGRREEVRSLPHEDPATRPSSAVARHADAEDVLRAVRSGEVDAFVIATPAGDRIYTLEGADQYYRTLMESMADGAVNVTREGLILYCNQAFSRMVEIPLEKVIGASIHDFVVASHQARFQGLLKGRSKAVGWEMVLRTAGGTALPVSLSLSFLPESDPPAFCLVVTDLTRRKRAEESLRETTRTLRELIHASPAGILVLDLQGKVLLWNPAMEQILGWTEEEVRGKLVPTVAAGQEGAREILERLRAGEALDGLEVRRMRKDGLPVDIQLWTTPLRGDNGNVKSILEIVLDITRIKAMEEAALRQEKMASLGQVAAGIAHEIRNPLSGLNISLHYLESLYLESKTLEPENREKMGNAVGRIQLASTRMESIINKVLAFSQPGLPRMEPLDINACIRETVDMAWASLKRTGSRLSMALREDLPRCRGDMRLIEQALLNLLTNAAQAMERQESERVIEIDSSRGSPTPGDGDHVLVSVADSGPGIPEAIREKIFDPFFTTKGSGTGIGLFITRKIVSDHGGFITVGKSRWGGALFTMGLPAGAKEKTPAA